MKRCAAILMASLVGLTGCASSSPTVSNVTPFIPHVSRSNAEIIARYKEAREAGLSHDSAYAYARGDRTYTSEQLDVLGISELYNETQLI